MWRFSRHIFVQVAFHPHVNKQASKKKTEQGTKRPVTKQKSDAIFMEIVMVKKKKASLNYSLFHIPSPFRAFATKMCGKAESELCLITM